MSTLTLLTGSRGSVASTAARSGIAVLTGRSFSKSKSFKMKEQHVERGFLFSAPCLDPEIRKHTIEIAGPFQSQKREMGVLFSAPCLDPDVRASIQDIPPIESPGRTEKGILFSAPCLDMTATELTRKLSRTQANALFL